MPLDAYGRLYSNDLANLAREIDRRPLADARARKPFEIDFERWHRLREDQAIFNGGSGICDGDCDRLNFIWRGTPVVMAMPKESGQ